LLIDGPSQDAALDAQLRSFWELESFGICDSTNTLCDDFSNTVHFVEGRYEVKLPWKELHQALPDNYHPSLKRLRGLIRRLRQDPDVLREYDSIIRDQIRRGIVEPVEMTEDPSEISEKVHYLPHHPVVRRDKETTKVRVVYDASSHADGPSLNDCLHTGPKFDQKIFDILLRFRVHRVVVTADIEKAFLMVGVAREDRDVLRFLWFDDAFSEEPKVVELRFSRVVFGVSSSPYLLNATIRHHLQQYSQTQPELVQKISKSMYVDDLVTGADTEEQALQMFQDSKRMLKEGGFNLRKFCSNSVSLQARIEGDEAHLTSVDRPNPTREWEESYTSSTLGPAQKMLSGEQKVLGIHWNVLSDHFVFNLEEIAATTRDLSPTKRNIIGLVGRFYDPLGFLAPIVVKFKMFFQELCGAKLEWDEPLSGGLLSRWNVLKSSLYETQPISIPRCYFAVISGPFVSHTLCGFCDASLKAYAGVVYLLSETESGPLVRFVAAKTRVSPLKEQTIPRLELLSALLLARLLVTVAQSLEGEIELSPPRCFTDSTVALFWILGTDKTWKPFVENRVHEIRKLLPPHTALGVTTQQISRQGASPHLSSL
jgi:hypothetical protein